MDKIETSISIIGVRSDCVVGTAVAHDGKNYIPANPYWTTNTANNQIEPAPAAYIVGILMSKNTDGNGTLLLQGAITDASIIEHLTGDSYPACGEYYLAKDGTLKLGVDPLFLPVFCGTLIKTDLFIVNPKAPEFYGHSHALYPLTSGWAGTSTTGYGYKYNSDTTAERILSAVPAESIAVISGGALMSSSGYTISGGALYVTNAPGNTAVQLSPINRLISTDPEIRSIAPADGNDVVKLSKVFGTVYIDTDFTTTESTALSGKAVTSVDKSGVTIGDVVQKVEGGTGITVSDDGNGTVTIENTTISPYLDLQAINADNVLIGVGTGSALYTFPAGANSTLTGVIRLPASMNDAAENPIKKFKPFAWVLGAGGNIAVELQIQGPPGTGVVVATPEGGSIPTPPESVGTNDITECLDSDVSYTAPNNALVTVMFSASQPGNNIRIKALGIKLVDA